jgi:hypothetical protein
MCQSRKKAERAVLAELRQELRMRQQLGLVPYAEQAVGNWTFCQLVLAEHNSKCAN